MRFRTLVIAAAILSIAAIAGLAAYQMGEQARGEATQQTIDATDSLAVEPGIRQTLNEADQNHSATAYGDDVTVTYNGSTWAEGTDYEYYPSEGDIEFLRDEPGEADIAFRYDIPQNQVADDQLQTVTESYGQIMLVGTGLAFVVLLLFVGGFAARKLGVGRSRMTRGR